MEFLVGTELTRSLPTDAEDRAALLTAERAEGHRLKDLGVITAMWRIPGRQANVAIMVAADATQLHEYITGLPLWPYTTVTVEVLANHPLMDSRDGPR